MNKYFRKNFILILLAITFVSFILFEISIQKDKTLSKGQSEITIPVYIGQKQFNAIVADTPASKTKGLGDRDSIPKDTVMLFVFDTPAQYEFWMKDMRFAIDIIWVGENRQVVFEKKNVLPSSFPEIFTPLSPAKYVLEANAGFAEENDIKIGSLISF